MKQELIICKGAPASGKTTYAKKWAEENSKTRVRINRDDIRRMLGLYWVPSRETLVTRIEHSSVNYALNKGYSVIVDATNFNNSSTWEFMVEMMARHDKPITLIYKDFTDISMEECIKRDKEREYSVGEEVIRKFYDKYINKNG
jgi:tRNA uridine 5-carbamoylmethylation protein Kti12